MRQGGMNNLLFQLPGIVLLLCAVLLLARAIFPIGIIKTISAPLYAIVHFITPLGFPARLVAVFGALWFLGIRAALPLMFLAWSFV
jgi:hypothetical protein